MVVRNVGVTAEFASENQFKELIQWAKVKVARNFIVKANAALTGYKAALARPADCVDDSDGDRNASNSGVEICGDPRPNPRGAGAQTESPFVNDTTWAKYASNMTRWKSTGMASAFLVLRTLYCTRM